MPIRDYFDGHGNDVMKSMNHRYGAKKGDEVFYATANKKGMGPKGPLPKPPGEAKLRKYSRRLLKGPLKEDIFNNAK